MRRSHDYAMKTVRDRFWDAMAAHRRLRDCYLSVRSWIFTPFQPTAIKRYLSSAAQPCLHLGAGRNVLPGWLNTDYLGHCPACLRLDVRKRFPFGDESFEYVFSEHMIEHVSYDDGMHMLSECRRVLKPGGILRVETPDLCKIVSVYEEPLDQERLEYLRFHAGVVKGHDVCASPCIAVNNAMRHWGHRFVYDEETLRHVFSLAGFDSVERVEVGRSSHEALNGLRNREWLETNEFETLALEATRSTTSRSNVGESRKREGSDHV